MRALGWVGTALVVGWLYNQAGPGPESAAAQAEPEPITLACTQLGSEQADNAAIIVGVGQEMGVSERGQVIAVATAMQESSLRNLDYGDRDSLGLFQQRPSQGWGSPTQVQDPIYAATQFYRHLIEVPNWEGRTLTDAAQTVQRSAYPNAYAKHEDEATAMVAAVQGACG